VTSGFDKRLIVWDAETLTQRRTIATAHENSIISVDFSPDGKTFVSVDAGGHSLFWDTATWQPRSPLQQAAAQPLIGLSFRPDGRTLAAGSFDGVVRFWDVASGRLLPNSIAAYTTGWALSVRFDPQGKILATGGGDGVIKLWDVASGQIIGAPLTGHTSRVTDLLFSPDGATLTSAGADGTIRFWNVADGSAAGDPLVSGRDQVWGLWSAAGSPQRLLALHQDGSLADWDTAARTLNRPLLHTQLETEEMRVAAGGDRAYIASTGPVAQVLTLPDEEWAAACRIANRTLSEDEWRKYMHQLPYDPACQ
jgi:WD40 repeat protein